MPATSAPPRPSTRPSSGPVGPRPTRFALASARRRSTALLVGFFFVLSLFAGRLVELQVLRASDLAAKGLDQRLRTTVIPAERGEITDASGRSLAQTVEVRDITVDQTLVEDPAETAEVLAPIMGMDRDELERKLTGDKRFVYLAKRVDPAVWRAIVDWRSDRNNQYKVLQALFSERLTVRKYPNGTLAANVLGFTNAEGKGAVGLEYGLEPELAGKPGEFRAERGPDGSVIPGSVVSSADPMPGTGVRLTLDADLQWVAQNAIANRVKDADADFGMVVAMEVGTGRILAMASVPTFDPNQPGQSTEADWSNRPVTHAFEPGSTMKVLTMAALLEEGAITAETPFTVPGGLARGPHVFKDHWPHGTLQLTATGVVAKSSNIGTILAAERMPQERLYHYLKEFGVGSQSGLQYPGESAGLLPDPAGWSVLTHPSLAFGQGMALTALQITEVYATLANGGVRVDPKLIDAYLLPDGTLQATPPSPERRVVSEETADTVLAMMERVVSKEGTAPIAAIPGYRVGGKTGTAERFEPTCGCYRGYTTSFIGVAPADDPKVVVGVWLDNPRSITSGGIGGSPVFREVTKAALASLRVPPSGTAPSDLPIVPGATS